MADAATLDTLYAGLQQFKQYIQSNFPYKATIFEGSLDPSVDGVNAPIPAFYAQKDIDGALVQLFFKYGFLSTEWTAITTQQVKTLVAGNNITLDEGPNSITINAAGLVNGATNIGDGYGLYNGIFEGLLQFKSLDPGANINLIDSADLLTIAVEGVATLDINGKVPSSQLPDALVGAVTYQGTWNASLGTSPSVSPAKGYYWVVSVAGSTSLSGITDWKIGDWAIYNGTAWEKVDNTDQVTTVFGRTGTITAQFGDYSAFYQALDATLTALAGIVTAADQLVYATGVDSFSTTSFPSYARSLLAAATSQSNTLSTLGAIASTNGTGTTTTLTYPIFQGYKEVHANTTTSNSTFQLDFSFANSHKITFSNNCTLSFTGAVDGYASSLTLIIVQDATGGRVITFPASVKWEGGVAPTLSTAANAVDVITLFTVDGGTTIYAGLSIKGAA